MNTGNVLRDWSCVARWLMCAVLCSACGRSDSTNLRVYDPGAARFSDEAGALSCEQTPTLGSSEDSAEYRAAARRSIQGLRQELHQCYRAHPSTGSGCVGFAVDASGAVLNVAISTKALSRKLQDCVLLVGSRARFPPSAEPIGVVLPLTFVRARKDEEQAAKREYERH
jgi:hypothetical protein